jgi:hypothetical protein
MWWMGSSQVKGARAFLAGILENSHALELRLLDKSEEFFEILVGFTGETHDERGTDGEIRNAGTHAPDQIPDPGSAGFALHAMSMRSLICWSGMSTYFNTLSQDAMVSISSSLQWAGWV